MAAEIGNHSMAERFFQRALEQKNVAPDTVARLAELYERLHRADDAAVMVERALRLDNACALARLTQARLHRQAGRLAEAEQALRPALMAADLEWRIRSYYELGAICDRQGRYDDAMSAFLEAKALLQPSAPPLLIQACDSISRFLRKCKTTSRRTILQRWSDSGSGTPPTVSSVGLAGWPCPLRHHIVGAGSGFASRHRLGGRNHHFL